MSDRGRDPGVECGIGFWERDGGNSGRGVTDGSTVIRKEPVAGLKVVERALCGTGPRVGRKKRSDFGEEGVIRASRGVFGQNSWGGLVVGWMTFERGGRSVSRRRERKRERRDCESEFRDRKFGSSGRGRATRGRGRIWEM